MAAILFLILIFWYTTYIMLAPVSIWNCIGCSFINFPGVYSRTNGIGTAKGTDSSTMPMYILGKSHAHVITIYSTHTHKSNRCA